MKDTKITAKEVLASFRKEFSLGDILEVYAGILAYNMGWHSITEEREVILNKAMEYYMDKDYIRGFLPDEILDYAMALENGIDPEPENEWED